MPLPDLEAKLQFLKTPQAHREFGAYVACIETHMSWVFLLEKQVLKLKKPVIFPFLDFTTLAAREFYCREEVRLNARLAPGIYRGLVALQWQAGTLALVPDARLPALGETVDWLVLMQRLPESRMLLPLIASQQVTPSDIDALVAVLGAFYRAAPCAELSAVDYLARFKSEQASNRAILLQPAFKLRGAALALDRADVAQSRCADLLQARVTGHHVREGHGDLRPDHVFLLSPPVAIDCLEFNPQLRQVDPFAELTYLGLECDLAGAPWIAPRLLAGVARLLGDVPPPALLKLYTAHTALLRARLAIAHLLDLQPRSPTKWAPLAERYIAQALRATEAL